MIDKVTLIKGDLTVNVYATEVGAYKKDGWSRKGERPKSAPQTTNKGKTDKK